MQSQDPAIAEKMLGKKIHINSLTYEVRNMSFACHVLDGELGDKGALVVVENQLVLRYDINKVAANIKGWAEEMGMGFEILIAWGVIIRVALWHFQLLIIILL